MHDSQSGVQRGDAPSDSPARRSADPAATAGGTLSASLAFIACTFALAGFEGEVTAAVYALSFWHYLLYALAYRYGVVPLPVFKRDAVLLKGVALLAIAFAYLGAAPDVASLLVVAGGFALNALAAAVLGSDRTYYGHEIAGLPRHRETRFPYSLIAHPMLVGNMLAYGGMLLNAEFRAQWWPLACVHVGLNLGLLAMEHQVRPLRLAATGAAASARCRSRPRVLGAAFAGAALGGAVGWSASSLGVPPAAVLGIAVLVHAFVLVSAYGAARAPSGASLPG